MTIVRMVGNVAHVQIRPGSEVLFDDEPFTPQEKLIGKMVDAAVDMNKSIEMLTDQETIQRLKHVRQLWLTEIRRIDRGDT